MLLALFVLFLLAASSALVTAGVTVRLEEQRRRVIAVRLDQMIDGVVDETLARLARGERFRGVPPKSWAGGEVESRVEELAGDTVRIEARARLGPRRGRAEVLARLTPAGPIVVSWRRGSAAVAGETPQVGVE